MLVKREITDAPVDEISLIGSYCQVHWTSTHRLAKRQCERCVYQVRGVDTGMICLELLYDAIDGEHRQDEIHWVPLTAIQYLRALTPAAAKRRIESLEREVFNDAPKD